MASNGTNQVEILNETAVQIGDRIGHLTVIKLHNKHRRGCSWLCKCDCGKEAVFYTSHLVGSPKRRPNKSCGCSEYAHGGEVVKNLRLYSVWHGMVKRCYNPKSNIYERYGGKGIRVADCWRNDFGSFRRWALSNGYEDHLTIDRKDFTKGYSPENCRWVDYYVQNQNKGQLKNNKTGVKGVSKVNYGYRAYIQRYGVHRDLGFFRTLELAKRARIRAEIHFETYGTIENL